MSAGSGQFTGQSAARPHLVRGSGGLSGEVKDLREDIARDFAANAAIAVEEFTNVPATDADAIKTAAATVATAVTFDASDLDGAIGDGAISPPRNITVTTGGVTPADAPATATVKGKDVDGNDIEETITVAQTGTVANGVKAFSLVTSIDLPAADGTDATLAFGIGNVIGLSKTLKARAGVAAVLMEIIPSTGALGPDALTGTFVLPATGAPHGTYEPAAAPNDTNDYAVYYEYDASLNT